MAVQQGRREGRRLRLRLRREVEECRLVISELSLNLDLDLPNKLPPALTRLMAGQWKKGAIPPKWGGRAAERIVEHLEEVPARTLNPSTPKTERVIGNIAARPKKEGGMCDCKTLLVKHPGDILMCRNTGVMLVLK